MKIFLVVVEKKDDKKLVSVGVKELKNVSSVEVVGSGVQQMREKYKYVRRKR